MNTPEARRAVIARWARLNRHGTPIFCKPGIAELTGVKPRRGSDGKVIYDSREQAEYAAREFEHLGCIPLRAYPCPRSRKGHYHLTAGPHNHLDNS